jgi:hypothetical protein
MTQPWAPAAYGMWLAGASTAAISAALQARGLDVTIADVDQALVTEAARVLSRAADRRSGRSL